MKKKNNINGYNITNDLLKGFILSISDNYLLFYVLDNNGALSHNVIFNINVCFFTSRCESMSNDNHCYMMPQIRNGFIYYAVAYRGHCCVNTEEGSPFHY